ncbi:MAG TPA: BapA prefix-like domain-containing protein, partial [Hyphomicrobiales bacterium]|nr:BapA prefix-like domain-containing protein [Hyphomicrobiales bacterium]
MAEKTIEIISKSSGDVTSVSAGEAIALTEGSVVKLPYGPEEIASITQQGTNLVVVLKSGERVVIGDFFAENGESSNQLVLEDSNGVLWL